MPTASPACRERIDYKGDVCSSLDDAAAEDARSASWSTDKRSRRSPSPSSGRSSIPRNEQQVSELVERIAPSIYCTLSSDIAPVPGEYERTSTTVINAYAGRITQRLSEGARSAARARPAIAAR